MPDDKDILAEIIDGPPLTKAAAEGARPRVCGHEDCSTSTGIDGSLTFGRGELDDYGYWEFPCAPCARKAESDPGLARYGKCWPFEEDAANLNNKEKHK